MPNSCIYCKTSVSPDSPVEVCRTCGIQVWGEKMFQAIHDNMQKAKDDGDLHQGSVSNFGSEEPTAPQPIEPSENEPTPENPSGPLQPTTDPFALSTLIQDTDSDYEQLEQYQYPQEGKESLLDQENKEVQLTDETSQDKDTFAGSSFAS